MKSTIFSKPKNLDGIPKKTLNAVGDVRGTSRSGYAGGQSVDPTPHLNKTGSEIEYKNAHNASIVLGKDRPGSRLSGFGGRGDTHCGSIDLVVGRMASKAKAVNKKNEPIYADPSFMVDAARVYMSQKTNVDENFKLAKGSMPYSKTRSSVAVKADAVRVISREGIKLVTGVDKINSQGSEINTKSFGIDLIAGNDDSDLQPIAKGHNLADALLQIVDHLDKLGGIVDAFLHSQMIFNSAVQAHTHLSPFFGIPATPSPTLQIAGPGTSIDQFARVKTGLLNEKVNLALFRIKYLNPVGDSWINSSYNNTN